MDCDLLLNNPKQLIDDLAQVTDEMPDLGLKEKIDLFLSENPDFLDQIPVVATLGHLQMTLPGTLVRLRCVLVQNLGTDYLPLRIPGKDKYYTPIYQQDIPDDVEMPDTRTFAQRTTMLVSSIPFISPWLINEFRPDIEPQSQQLSLQDFKTADPGTLFEEPFQLKAKFLYNQPDVPCLMYDLIGFIDDPEPINSQSTNLDEEYYSSIPAFITLTSTKVESLYTPEIASTGPSLGEMRAQLMSFLTEIFEPLQAELLLLWLVGCVKSRKEECIIGLFSLNLFEVDPDVAQFIINLFRYLLTSVIDISLNIDTLNSISLRPSIEHCELKPTPLIAASETRLIINETELDVGNFNQTGTENCRILQKIIGQQAVDYAFEGEIFQIFVSYPTLILSQTRSVLSDPLNPIQAYAPIGEVRQPDSEINPDLLVLLRNYIENIRYLDFDIQDEDTKFAENQLHSVIQSNRELTHNDLHFLMILNKLNCISHGADSINKEIWDRSLEIFATILPFQRK